MPVNPHFQPSKGESELLESIAIEIIQTRGVDIVYIPRELVNLDQIFGEDTISRFSSTYEIEAWIENFSGWQGEGDYMTKLGFEIRQGLDFLVSISRFKTLIGEKHSIAYPNEGDLVYVGFMKKLFEITKVDKDATGLPFYQLKDLHVYRLQTRLFTYSHEELSTGAPTIDALEERTEDPIYEVGVTGDSSDYYDGETVTMGSTAAALAIDWNATTFTLLVRGLTGTFTAGVTLDGETSEAAWVVTDVTAGIKSQNPVGDSEALSFEDAVNEILNKDDVDAQSEGSY